MVVAGCSGAGVETSGPPEVVQVFVRERVDGELAPRLAFGDHPDIGDDDDRDVTDAVARDGQRIRVVVDQLLRGNRLEEVACADGSWGRVPDDATYQDVAARTCSDAGGILDRDGDGAIDDTRLIDGAVVLTCDGAVVPLDPQRSYWQPSGSQALSTIGPDSLGPAIAIVTSAGMPPGSTCTIGFGDQVIGKDGARPCAGDPCTPGDTGAIHFSVEPLLVAASDPLDAAEDVDPAAPIRIQLNAGVDAASLAGAISLTAAGAAVDAPDATVDPDDDATIAIAVPGGLAPDTTYTLAVHGGADGVADVFGDHLAADTSITWTTKE